MRIISEWKKGNDNKGGYPKSGYKRVQVIKDGRTQHIDIPK